MSSIRSNSGVPEKKPGEGSGAIGAWRRFRRHRVAGWAALMLGVAVGIGTLSLPFSARWYNVQSLGDAVRHAPSTTAVVPDRTYLRELEAVAAGNAVQALAPTVLRVSGWLGYDDLGRSLLFRLLPGFLISLLIGLASAGLAVVLGVAWGAVAGLVGGRLDALMMRVVDVLYSLPYLLTVILLKIALTRPLTVLLGGQTKLANLAILLLAIGGVSWLTMARVVRGQVLSLREQAFVEAARAAGAGSWHILRVHLLPNLIGPIIVYGTLVVPQAILQESFLSFLGIGVQQPMPSLGGLAADGVQAVNTFVDFWWLLVWPCALLALALLALNFIGDGIRDAFDPRAEATKMM